MARVPSHLGRCSLLSKRSPAHVSDADISDADALETATVTSYEMVDFADDAMGEELGEA